MRKLFLLLSQHERGEKLKRRKKEKKAEEHVTQDEPKIEG